MAIYTARRDDGNTETIEADGLHEAGEIAEAWVLEGTWGNGTRTAYVRVLIEDQYGDETPMTIHVHPKEPPCPSDEKTHDWQRPHHLVGGLAENPGVHGHGGGVIIASACVRCGAQRIEDTWAQDPETGEQELYSIKYDEPGYFPVP